MRANGETLNRNPRIIMSTIHGAKGGEADKVLLMQDITNAALETFSYDPDELHRLFYTGATRAKRELHVLDPRDFDRAYIARLEKMKGRHRAKIEILNEILNWIELGKSFEDIQQHCSLSIDYHDMQVEVTNRFTGEV